MSETSSNAIPAYLPLRNDLIGEEPYGAPQAERHHNHRRHGST